MNTTGFYLITAIIISLSSILSANSITPVAASTNILEEAGEVDTEFSFEESTHSQSIIASVASVSSVVSASQEFSEEAGSRSQGFEEDKEADLSRGAWVGIGLAIVGIVFIIIVHCVHRRVVRSRRCCSMGKCDLDDCDFDDCDFDCDLGGCDCDFS